MRRSKKLLTLCGIGLIAAPVPPASPAPTCLGKPATIVGTPGDDRLFGTANNDVIVGRAGTDSIYGFAGNDLICAGPGGWIDREDPEYYYQYVKGGLGNDTLKGGPFIDWLDGKPGADKLFARGGGDQLYGGSGRDLLSDGRAFGSLEGGPGPDRLLAGRGSDRLAGSEPGNDVIRGGPQRDYISTAVGGAVMKVDLSANIARSVRSGRDRVFEVEDVYGFQEDRNVFIGDEKDNELFVNAWDEDWRWRNIIVGKGGDDEITTGFGNDLLRGGPGDDLLRDPGGNDRDVGGRGRDVLDFMPYRWRTVRANLRIGRAYQGSETDRLISIEGLIGSPQDDVLKGDAKRNNIRGDMGDDIIEGRAGADYLVGGSGHDRINGGAGNDECFSAETTLC